MLIRKKQLLCSEEELQNTDLEKMDFSSQLAGLIDQPMGVRVNKRLIICSYEGAEWNVRHG